MKWPTLKGSSPAVLPDALLFMDPFLSLDLLASAKEFFAEQTGEDWYTLLMGSDDPLVIHPNEEIMEEFREVKRPLDYHPERYESYLEELGIEYPLVREDEREH